VVETFVYDGQGRRIRSSTSGAATLSGDYYFNESWQLLEQTQCGSPGTTYEQYVWDPRYIDAPVARFDVVYNGGAPYYYCQDANFNTTAVVTGSSGTVAEQCSYDAYGKTTYYSSGSWSNSSVATATANYLTFTGQYVHAKTRIMNFKNRIYNPATGTFMTNDNGYPDGMNRSAAYFVPNGTDPTGLWKITRDGKSTAKAEAEAGDAVRKLAIIVGLDPDQYKSWLGRQHTYTATSGLDLIMMPDSPDEAVMSGCPFTIPNTVLAFWAGELGGFGKSWVQWRSDADVLAARGFKVNEQSGWKVQQFEDYIRNSTTSKELHGIFFWGHGWGYKESGDFVNVADGILWTGTILDSSHKNPKKDFDDYWSTYTDWRPKYYLGLGVLWACGTNAARFQFGPSAIFRGSEGVLYPHGLHLFGDPMDRIIPPGAQGTKK